MLVLIWRLNAMTQKNTIVISANTSWYIYNFRKNTICKLIDAGYQVVIVAPYDRYSDRLSEIASGFFHVDIDQGGTNPIKDIKTLLSLRRIYKKIKPSVVLNFTPKNNIYSTLAAKCVGASVINNIAGLGFLFVDESIKSKIARLLYRFSQPLVTRIFFQNEDDKELFLKYNLAPIHLVDRLPGSGVDLERFKPVYAPDDGNVRFLLIARMLFDKGVGQYVEAARQLKTRYGDSVEFRLLGFLDVDNPTAVTHKQMKAWTSEGIVTYLGTSDNVEKEIGKVDCVVLPSFYREGVPKSLLEAAAMAKPIITTDNVGCRETVIDNVSGYLCKPRSTESLIKKLDAMISLSHAQRLVMGVQSRKKVEAEFDERIVIQKYLDAVSDCLNARVR